MKVFIPYSGEGSAKLEDIDTWEQAVAIERALSLKGYQVVKKAVGSDIQEIAQLLQECQPDCIFNLIEIWEGSDALAYLPIELFEASGIPFTGSSSFAYIDTNHKLKTKALLQKKEIPTPDFYSDSLTLEGAVSVSADRLAEGYWIVKSATEHGSLGIDQDSVVQGKDAVLKKMEEKNRKYGGIWFAEQYIEGRELGVFIIKTGKHFGMLLPSEIVFLSDPARIQAFSIQDHASKWDTGSTSFANTYRRFTFPHQDKELAESMKDLAIRCWNACNLSGYARIDMRVDAQGNPWVFEVTTNPCMNPHGSFTVAAKHVHWSYSTMIEYIVKEGIYEHTRGKSVRRRYVG